MKRVVLILLSLLIGGATLFSSNLVSAVAASDWRVGNIIDDSVFTDKNELSVSQIQQFLNSKVTNCDTWGTQPSEFGGGTRAQYGAANGNPAPFTCLKEYYEVPKTAPGPDWPASNYGGKAIPTGAVSAAQVIWNAAQKYNISPAVLLVKLGTESAGPLTSDDWPFQKQYLYAMGAHCPDTPEGHKCDPNWSGFSLQMDEAASLMRSYLDNMTQSWWQYKKPYQNNDILIQDVNVKNCGSTSVYIETKATAALYTYTPYQPNEAALNNMYGTGDACSTYGNRNFWRVYNDWFGPTRDRNPIVRSWQSGKMYFRSSNGNLYYISNGNQLTDLGYGNNRLNGYQSVDDTYVSTHSPSDLPAIVTFGDAPEAYYYERGVLHYIDYSTYMAYGSQYIGNLPAYTKNYFSVGAAATTAIRNYSNGDVYKVASGARRYIVGPDAYNYYSIGTTPLVDASTSLIGNIAETIPLAKPGTIINTGNGATAGIVDSSGDALYVANPALLSGTSAPRFTVAPPLFSKYATRQGATIGFLTKDSSNNLFILNRSNKINLTQTQLGLSGYTATDFIAAPDVFMNLFSTISTKTNDFVVRIASSQSIYVVRNKEVLRFENAGDFASFGYQLSDVNDLAQSTYDSLFTNRNITILPTGLLVKGTDSPRVYLVTRDGAKSPIPTAYLFTNIGYKFDWVRTTTPQAINYMVTDEPLAPYAKDSSGQQWLLYQGKKQPIPSSLANDYALPMPIAQIKPWQLDSLPTLSPATKFIRIDSTQDVYLVESGKTYLLSARMYQQYGGTGWTDITSISRDIFDRITHGEPRI